MVAARCWIAAAAVFFASCSFAGEVVVAVPLSMQPYFLPFSGNGLAYDTIRASFAAQGHSVRPLYVSSRQIEKLLTGESRADCLPMISPGSEQGWHTSESIHLLHDFAVSRPGVRLSSLDDLRNKRVLGYSGALSQLGKDFRSVARDNPQYREIGNHRAQVRLLLQGSVDVIIADRLLVSWYLNYLRGEGKQRTEVVFNDLFEPVVHEFVCRNPELSAQFSDGLTEILENGTFREILTNYSEFETDAILRRFQKESRDARQTERSDRREQAVD